MIAKSDSLQPDERAEFKKRIREELDFHGVRFYPFNNVDEELYEPDTEEEQLANKQFSELKVLDLC